jgi:glycerol-3-phosphate acyltransferase PlsY
VVNLPVVVYSRYISLGSILGSVTAPFAMLLLAILAPSLSLGAPSFIYLLYPSVATPMVVFKHRDNILRLVRGQERKLGESSMGAAG